VVPRRASKFDAGGLTGFDSIVFFTLSNIVFVNKVVKVLADEESCLF
jgi:hypothetical protein